jgi:hypothetical protein
VLAVFEENPDDGRGWSPHFDKDFYCWHDADGGWAPHDQAGMLDYLQLERTPVVLRGYWIPRALWKTTLGKLSRRISGGLV